MIIDTLFYTYRSNSSTSKMDNSFSCGHMPQQIIGLLWPEGICWWTYIYCWPRDPAKQKFEGVENKSQLRRYCLWTLLWSGYRESASAAATFNIHLTAARTKMSPFSMFDNPESCGHRPQQIMGGRSSHKGSMAGPKRQPYIVCWPRRLAKVCKPRNEAAVCRVIAICYRLEPTGNSYLFVI